MTQGERIMEYMARFGSITPMEAFSDLGITKLATRVSELRAAGEDIEDEYVLSLNRFGEKVRYKRYWICCD